MERSRGFTTVELMTMIVIIAILAASSVIFVGFMNGIKLQSAAEKLSVDIRYAQNIAMSKTLWFGVSFEASPVNKYLVYQTNGVSDSAEADPARFGDYLSVDLKSKFDVSIVSVALEGGQKKVEFNGLGVPYTDYNGWQVSNEGTVVIGLGSLSKTIRIYPFTGTVSIE